MGCGPRRVYPPHGIDYVPELIELAHQRLARYAGLFEVANAAANVAKCRSPKLHVHLWKGDASLREYEAQLKAARQEVAGFGAMWFGGPNQALQGQPEQVRAANDDLIALAAKHPKLMPIATVHPYDGAAAVAELQRVAARGVKLLKLHPHTQKFDAADPRVLRLAQRAGAMLTDTSIRAVKSAQNPISDITSRDLGGNASSEALRAPEPTPRTCWLSVDITIPRCTVLPELPSSCVLR